MVSESDLVTRLRQILRGSDLDTATSATVRRQLENDFGVDLSDRKAFVRDQIDIFLETLPQKQEQEEGVEVGGESENVELEVEENDVVEEEEEEEEEEKECEGKGRKKRGPNKVDKEVKKRGGGFQKLCSLSPQLQKVVGVPELGRTEVVKKLWAYIRENNLQDPKNKRNIRCDESLRALFRVNTINMFQMNKVLSKHIWPLIVEDEDVKQKIKNEDSGSYVSEGDEEDEDTVSNVEEQVQEDEEEEEEDEEEESSRQGSKKGGPTKVEKDVKKRGGGFNKPSSLSPQLQTVIGVSKLARTEVVKKLWAYIRENNLQDPKNKRNIKCDESLRALFRVESINMFHMNKVLSKHIWPLNEEDGASDDSSEKDKLCKQGREEDSDEQKRKGKRQKKGGSGLLASLPLSDALVKFLGTGENVLSRVDVVKRMWEYIKQNDLQDPSDKRRIICDDKLKELFEVDTFIGFTVSKLLTAHFIKTEYLRVTLNSCTVYFPTKGKLKFRFQL